MRTTISLRRALIHRIVYLEEKLGIKSQTIIFLAFQKFQSRLKVNYFKQSLIRYQERGFGYCPFHVSFSFAENERNNDLKRVFKLSVSFMYALALELYLDEVVMELQKEDFVYSYPHQAYCFMRIKDDDHNCFIFFWKIPTKELSIFENTA